MKHTRWHTLAAVLWLAAPASAQVAAPGLEQFVAPRQREAAFDGTEPQRTSRKQLADAADVELQMLYERWMELGRQRNQYIDRLNETLTKYAENSPQVEELRKSIEVVEVEIASIKQKLEATVQAREERVSGRGRRLLRPVAVQLQNATVRQAADVLSQATKLAIRVEGDVPNDTRLTVQARGVTLGAVLEAIGRQANLKLAPTDDGVVISRWPMVEINGQQQVFRGRLAPWSSDWGLLPGYASRDGWVFPGEASSEDTPVTTFYPQPGVTEAVAGLPSVPPGVAPQADPFQILPPAQAPDPSGAGGYVAGRSRPGLPSSAMAISMASLGERSFAVSEPGRGPDGQPGAWITIYRIEGTQLTKTATGFHPLHSSAPTRSGSLGAPGVPGLPGGSGLPPMTDPLGTPTVPSGSPLPGTGATAPLPQSTTGGLPASAGVTPRTPAVPKKAPDPRRK